MAESMERPKKVFLEFGANGNSFGNIHILLNGETEASRVVLQTFYHGRKGGYKMQVRQNFISSYDHIDISASIVCENLFDEMAKKKWKIGDFGIDLWVGGANNESTFKFCICVGDTNLEHKLCPTGVVDQGMDIVSEAYERMARGEEVVVIGWGWIH